MTWKPAIRWRFASTVQRIQIALDRGELRAGVLQLLSAELDARGALLAVGRADGRAVQTERFPVQYVQLPAGSREDEQDLPELFVMLLSEVRDGAEVGAQPVQQKEQLDVSPALPMQPPRGADSVLIAIDEQFHQIARTVRRPARRRGHSVLEAHFLQIEALHKHFDEPRRAVPRDFVLDTPNAQRHLPAVRSRHIAQPNAPLRGSTRAISVGYHSTYQKARIMTCNSEESSVLSQKGATNLENRIGVQPNVANALVITTRNGRTATLIFSEEENPQIRMAVAEMLLRALERRSEAT